MKQISVWTLSLFLGSISGTALSAATGEAVQQSAKKTRVPSSAGSVFLEEGAPSAGAAGAAGIATRTIGTLTRRLITKDMSKEEVYAIKDAIDHIPCGSKGLVFDSVRAFIKEDTDPRTIPGIIRAVTILSPDRRKELTRVFNLLKAKGMDMYDLPEIIENLSSISPDRLKTFDRVKSFVDQVIFLITEDGSFVTEDHSVGTEGRVSRSYRSKIIGTLGHLPADQSEKFVETALSFIKKGMDINDRLLIISALEEISKGKFDDIVKAANLLITEHMGGRERSYIIDDLRFIPEEKFDEVVKGVFTLATDDMDGDHRCIIIKALSNISADRIKGLVAAARPHITEGMDGLDRVKIIYGLQESAASGASAASAAAASAHG